MFGVTMRNYRRAHLYSYQDFVDAPSVTKILKVLDDGGKDAIANWRFYGAMTKISDGITANTKDGTVKASEMEALVKEARKRDTKAMDKGSEVHKMIEDTFNGKPNYGYSNHFSAAMGALQELKVERLLGIEVAVFNTELRYGGTIDGVFQDRDGNTILLDWKTGKDLYPSYAYQLAAYGMAYAEHTGVIPTCAAVLLNDDGTFRIQIVNWEPTTEIVKLAVKAYYGLQQEPWFDQVTPRYVVCLRCETNTHKDTYAMCWQCNQEAEDSIVTLIGGE